MIMHMNEMRIVVPRIRVLDKWGDTHEYDDMSSAVIFNNEISANDFAKLQSSMTFPVDTPEIYHAGHVVYKVVYKIDGILYKLKEIGFYNCDDYDD